jgi:hypothetical protein
VYCRSTGTQWLLRCSTFDSNWRLHRQSLCVHVQEVHLLQIYRCRVSDITNNILVVELVNQQIVYFELLIKLLAVQKLSSGLQKLVCVLQIVLLNCLF